MGKGKRVQMWHLLVGISLTVHISVVILSDSSRRMTALS